MEKPRIAYSEFAAQMKYADGSVASFIERRIKESRLPGARAIGQSGVYILRRMQREQLGSLMAAALKASDLIDYGRRRKAEGVCPATIKQDISYLRGTMRDFVDLEELPKEVLLAFMASNRRMEKEQLVGKSAARERLPAEDELRQLREHFAKSNEHRSCTVDMVLGYDFLLASGRRISEMCRIERAHVNVENRTCMLYNMKDPHGKGKHGEFALLGDAWTIVEKRLQEIGPEPTARLFPWRPQTVSSRGTSARKELKIIGLRTHDNRAACFTKLLEQGYSIAQVQKGVSLHKDQKTLVNVYARIKAVDLHRGPASASR